MDFDFDDYDAFEDDLDDEDGFEAENMFADNTEPKASGVDDGFDLDWFDLATAGALSEEIAEEEVRRRELERELSKEIDD